MTPSKGGRVKRKCVWYNLPECKKWAVKGSEYCSPECWKRSEVSIDGNSHSGRMI